LSASAATLGSTVGIVGGLPARVTAAARAKRAETNQYCQKLSGIHAMTPLGLGWKRHYGLLSNVLATPIYLF
jgi:hypothetical protein